MLVREKFGEIERICQFASVYLCRAINILIGGKIQWTRRTKKGQERTRARVRKR